MSDRERLAVDLWPALTGRELIDSDYEDVAWLDTLEIADAILTSDWLATHDENLRDGLLEEINRQREMLRTALTFQEAQHAVKLAREEALASVRSAGDDDAYDMCPNCITPWKCNGPHLEGQTPRSLRAVVDTPAQADT